MKTLKLSDEILVFCFRTATGTACDGVWFDSTSIDNVQPLGTLIISTTIQGESIALDRISDISFLVCFSSTDAGIAVGGIGKPQTLCTVVNINESRQLALAIDKYLTVCKKGDSCFDLTLTVISTTQAIICYSFETKKKDKSECGLIGMDLSKNGNGLSYAKEQLVFKTQGTRGLVVEQVSLTTAIVCYAVPNKKYDESIDAQMPNDHLNGECLLIGVVAVVPPGSVEGGDTTGGDTTGDSMMMGKKKGSNPDLFALTKIIEITKVNSKTTSDISITRFEKDKVALCYLAGSLQLSCRSLVIGATSFDAGPVSVIAEDQTIYDIKSSRLSVGMVSVCFGDASGGHSCYMLSKSDGSLLRKKSKKISFNVFGMSFDGSVVNKGSVWKYSDSVSSTGITIQTWLAGNDLDSAEVDTDATPVPTTATTEAPTIANEDQIPDSIICHTIRFDPSDEQKVCRLFREPINYVPTKSPTMKEVAEPGYCESLDQAWMCQARNSICDWDGTQCKPDP